jgi:predicted nucleic acid-binding protein
VGNVEDGLIVDTDILIDLLRKKDYAVSLIKKLEDEVELATSAINAFELYRGAYKSRNQEKNLASVKGLLNSLRMLNTDEDSVEIAGKTTASLERDGNMMDIRDLLIASIALVNGFGILTNNVGHFDKIKHLRVVSGKAKGNEKLKSQILQNHN